MNKSSSSFHPNKFDFVSNDSENLSSIPRNYLFVMQIRNVNFQWMYYYIQISSNLFVGNCIS
ncbi:hypothetical protein SAMN04487992_101365 [Cellulophaga baltica]|uniref:Uncharacterized protein n=1 Tax=Cellulophaga baltica TaxID=76594 RepID=A0A1G7D5T1_9FLAO|nr:hypothetical protein SAMN04487992_101365 [Cellulophaga baltica]